MSDYLEPQKSRYVLTLYVNDNTPQSVLALGNLKQLLEKHLAGRYQIEVIDLMKNPELAKKDQIMAVPTLVRSLPLPIRKFIGTLSDSERILIDLDLIPNNETNPSAARKGEKDA